MIPALVVLVAVLSLSLALASSKHLFVRLRADIARDAQRELAVGRRLMFSGLCTRSLGIGVFWVRRP